MALLACPECSKMVSSIASACPSCGFPVEKCLAAPAHLTTLNTIAPPPQAAPTPPQILPGPSLLQSPKRPESVVPPTPRGLPNPNSVTTSELAALLHEDGVSISSLTDRRIVAVGGSLHDVQINIFPTSIDVMARLKKDSCILAVIVANVVLGAPLVTLFKMTFLQQVDPIAFALGGGAIIGLSGWLGFIVFDGLCSSAGSRQADALLDRIDALIAKTDELHAMRSEAVAPAG